jgi:hypothetical protein
MSRSRSHSTWPAAIDGQCHARSLPMGACALLISSRQSASRAHLCHYAALSFRLPPLHRLACVTAIGRWSPMESEGNDAVAEPVAEFDRARRARRGEQRSASRGNQIFRLRCLLRLLPVYHVLVRTVQLADGENRGNNRERATSPPCTSTSYKPGASYRCCVRPRGYYDLTT